MPDVAGARFQQSLLCVHRGLLLLSIGGQGPPHLSLRSPVLVPGQVSLGVGGGGAGSSEGRQQAISSKVPRAVCRGTFTVWLMVSEWFGIVSQVLTFSSWLPSSSSLPSRSNSFSLISS